MNQVQGSVVMNNTLVGGDSIDAILQGGVIPVSRGGLGQQLHYPSFAVSTGAGRQNDSRVTMAQAGNALQQIFSALPGAPVALSLPEVLRLDPAALSMMMTQLVLGVFGSNAQCLCQQLERATNVQSVLRDKQVKEYQEQIQKAVEQMDKARKAGIANALFDWIIGGVEAVVGILKMVDGVLTANPLEEVDGAAYLAAGFSGLLKAGAETAQFLGANKDTCQSISEVASKAQLGCEGIALALDILQIGRGFAAARAVTSATEEVLGSEVSEELLNKVVSVAEDFAEGELESLAESVGDAVGKKLGHEFGMIVEREMVQVGDMAIEAAARAIEAEASMVKTLGKSFTRAGVENMVKVAVEAGVKTLLKEGEAITEETLRDAIINKLRLRIARALISDCSTPILQTIRATTEGTKLTVSGVINLKSAEIHRQIEQLINQQTFIDFMEDWTEEQKKMQQKRLEEAYQSSSKAIKSALDVTDSYGSVLTGMVTERA